MVVVEIKYNVDALLVHGGGLARSLSGEISNIVAKTLDCANTGGQLLPENINVVFSSFGNWDKINAAVVVTISASLFPLRQENLQRKNARITKIIGNLLKQKFRKGSKIRVWTRLLPAASSELEI